MSTELFRQLRRVEAQAERGFDGEMGPYVQRVTQGLLYALWDLGLQVGHAVRSLPDCLAMARTDFPSRTSMQQARFLVGDRRLFNRFRKVLAENVYQKDFAQFLETTLAERDQRYRKFGGSPYIGEPNVKESAGGLRDIHEAMWLASTKFGTRTLRELRDKRLITDREQKTTDEALTRLMKVFWHCHRLGFELGVDVERAVEDALDLADESFRRSADVRDLFLSICRSWGRVATTCREMHDLGFLGRYLPEWGALTCLVQYDVYHKFTADQHSFLALEHLEALAPGQSDEEGIARVVNDVERPDLLMLGMLLHDIGKGRGHGHVAKGIPLIEALTARLALPADDADKVVFLVAHHLTMSHTAQRRDIDDPKTVEALAEVCRTPERLRMLYLLTSADMRAVGPGVMTGWQAQILGELYSRTLVRLTGGQVEPPSREAVTARVWEAMRSEGSRRV